MIPTATVTLTEGSNHVQHTAHTDSGGVYVFPNITIGTYSVSVAAAGFETIPTLRTITSYAEHGIIQDRSWAYSEIGS